MFGAGCLVLAHMPGPSIKGFHKREGGEAPTRETNKACVQKQKVWNSSTTWAFPLSPGMKINYKLDVPTFSWYGILLQIVRFRFQLVWKSFTIWAFPLPPMENEYKLGVPSFNWYENHLQTVRTHFQLV